MELEWVDGNIAGSQNVEVQVMTVIAHGLAFPVDDLTDEGVGRHKTAGLRVGEVSSVRVFDGFGNAIRVNMMELPNITFWIQDADFPLPF